MFFTDREIELQKTEMFAIMQLSVFAVCAKACGLKLSHIYFFDTAPERSVCSGKNFLIFCPNLLDKSISL